MRVLLLGNSNDGGQWFEGGRKRHEIVRDMLAETYGEPVDVITKTIWPNDSMATVADGWIGKHEPDVVYLTLLSYWFQYQSVPLRVKRLLGRLGGGVAGAGFKVADSPRWSHNAVFRFGRKTLQRTVGGDTHFTVDEVVQRSTSVIQAALRHEGVVVGIQGADGRTDYAFTDRGRRKQESRRLSVDAAMRHFCEQHHVTYDNPQVPAWSTDPALAGNRVGDGLHANAQWHERSAELIYNTIGRALEEAGHVPGGAAPATSPELARTPGTAV